MAKNLINKKKLMILFVWIAVGSMLATSFVVTEKSIQSYDPYPIGGSVSADICHSYSATITIQESGLSSEIICWGGHINGCTDGSLSPGSTFTHTVSWATTTAGGGFGICVSWCSVPGYSTPSSVKFTAYNGNTYTETGTYSGSPLPPSFSSMTSSPNPDLSGSSFSVSISPNYNDVSGGTVKGWSGSVAYYSGGTATLSPSGTATSITCSPTVPGTYTLTASISSDAGTTPDSIVEKVVGINVTASKSSADTNQNVVFTAEPPSGYSFTNYNFYINSASVQNSASSQLTYSFSSTGTYSIYVVGTESSGTTTQSPSISFSVNSDPTVSISSSQNPTDIGNSVTFTATGSGGSGSYTYQWYVGGNVISGATSSTYSPAAYTSSGTYDYYVAMTDGSGYTVNSNTIIETVNSDPTVSASASATTADVGYSISFSATPSGGTSPYTYSWTIGGTQESTSQDFSYSFSSAGTYTVEVTVTDKLGHTYSASVTVTINNNPSVSVSSSQNPTDIGNSVTFTASESGGTGTISYAWTVNGASEGAGSTLAYSFSSAGSYTVEVVVTDGDSHTSSYSYTETVYSDPSVIISSSQNPTDIGNSVKFTASPSGGSGSYTYRWYLNNAAVSGATSSTYATSFSSSGTDSIYVTITDTIGNSATSSALTETVNVDPSVSVSSSQNPTDIGNSVTFTASGNGGTGSYTYQWYLNNAAVSAATSSTYTTSFTSSGTYSIYVVLTDSLGNNVQSSTLSETVNPDPTVSVTSSQNPTDIGNSVTFTASASQGTGSFSYTWYVNGATQSSTTGSLDLSFSTAGSYYVNVTVKDSVGDSASYSFKETVNPDPAVSIISSQNPTDIGNSVTFTASGNGGTGSYTYQWYVGGSAISGATSSTYATSFSSSGTYSVYVAIADGIGNTAQSSTLTETVNPDPSVSITSSQNPTDIGNGVTFTASTSGGTGSLTYQWYLNSAEVSGATSSTYTTSFSSSGTDTVYVIITDSLGNTATSSTHTETVNADPSVAISTSQNPTDAGNSVTFTASPSGGTGSYTYQWYLNSAAVSGAASSTYTTSFSASGTNTVYVIIKDSLGNSVQSTALSETVNPDPSASITSSQNPTDIGNSVTFTALGNGGTGSYSYQWYVNSAAVSGATSSTYTTSFSSSGTDTIYVIIKDSLGNSVQSTALSETVNPDPVVSIASSQSPTDIGNSVTFTASASHGTGSFSYTWYINGATQSSTTGSLDLSFSTAGSYYVNVTVKDSVGDSASYSFKETVNPDPTVSIASSQNPTDLGNSVTFTASGSGGTGSYSYQWYVNSAAVSGATSSTYATSFSSSGTDTIYVIIKDSLGNTAQSSTLTETVNADPSVTISSSQNPTDVGNSVTFTASTSGGTGSLTYQWHLNGASISGATSSTYSTSFSSSGTDTVYVIITDSLGNTATSSTLTETVNADPSVGISSSQNPTDIGNSVTFTASGNGGTGSYTYQWYLNNAAVSAATSSTYTTSFGASGTNTVYVIIKDSLGNSVQSSTLSETVNPDPTVSITSSQNPTDIGNSVTFTASASGGTGVFSYAWYVNGATQSSTSDQLTYSFSSVGAYYVNVTIKDSLGDSTTYSFKESVNPDPSVSMSSSPNPTDAGVPVTFTATGSGGTSPYNYTWEIGSRVVSYGSSFTYTFTSPGTFSVTITLRDADGNTVTNTISETVNADPTVSISYEYGTVDQGVNDTFSASVSGGTYPVNYTWCVGSTIVNYSEDFHMAFSSTGTYTIKVHIRDALGETFTDSVTITVIAKPSISITGNTQTDVHTSTTFTGNASYGTEPYNFYWYVNGVNVTSASSGLYLSYTFTSSGTYNVSIKAVDSQDASAKAYLLVKVNPLPAVSFTSSLASGDVGQSSTFTSTVSGGSSPFTYLWFVDGNEVGSQPSLTYEFTTAGTKTIRLEVIDSAGNSAVSEENITINSLPSVSFTSKYVTIDVGIAEVFTSIASSGTLPYNYTWYVNNIASGYGSSLNYVFSSSGTYSIKLTLTDADQNRASSIATISVLPAPIASFSSSHKIMDVNDPDLFLSAVSGGTSPYNYTWEINGIAVGYASDFDHTFTSSGTYDIQLVVTDSFGLSSSYSMNISVNKSPSVSISTTKTVLDAGMSDSFNAAVSGGTSPYTYTWTVDDTTYTGQSITYSFTSPGTYDIQLVVMDSFGQSAKATISITVNPDPSVTISSSQNPTDIGNSVTFTANPSGGTGSYTYQWYLNNAAVSSATSSTYSTSFGASGTNTVYVVIKDSLGNIVQSSTLTETVNADPSVIISSSQNPTDIGNSVTFTASGNGGTGSYSYQWYVNSAAVSGATSSTYTTSFSSSGTDTIYVIIKDSLGNTAQSSTLTETVNPDPSVSITSSQNPTDIGNSVTFTASTGGGTGSLTYQWYLNGASISGATSSTYSTSFSSSGTDSIYVIVKDSLGNSVQSSTLSETVNADPSVTISSSQNPTDIGNSVTFTASPSGGTGSYTYQWYVGGNAISGATSSTYTTSFSSSGTDVVYVIITDSYGVESKSNAITETVNPDPSVTIHATKTTIDSGQSSQFFSSVSGGTGPYTYLWVLGANTLSPNASFTHIFSTPGTYNITLTVKDANGNTASSYILVSVLQDPSGLISVKYNSIDAGAEQQFTSSISGGSGSYTYDWLSGTNTIASSSSFSRVFYSIGSHTITLEVTDSDGFEITLTVSFDVIPQPSTSFTTQYGTIDAGMRDIFISSVSGGTSPYTYAWTVNGNVVGDSSSLAYTFTTAGPYAVNLTVTDSFGFTSTYSRAVQVVGDPVASIVANRTTIDSGMGIAFLSGISGGTGPYNYTWEVNGGIVSYTNSFDYRFTSPGTYTVELIITDSFGQSSHTSLAVVVNALPSVTATASSSTIDSGQSVSFTSRISGGTPGYSYLWEINGNAVSSQANLTYSFQSGIYSINLIATDALGETSSYVTSITVDPGLSASISREYPIVDENITDTITLNASNGTGPYSYAIFINGNHVSTADSYSQYFTSPGTYLITAYVNDSRGESITLRTSIIVRANPSVGIVTPDNRTDANVAIPFRGVLSGGTGPYNYSWLVAGHAYSNATLSFAFSKPGQYIIQLTVSDAFGRQAIASINETIYADPSATLTVPPCVRASIEEPLSLKISGGIPVYSIQWYFPGGEQLSGNNITHAFSTSGPDTIQARITDSTGYVDTQNFTVNVHLFVAISANTTSGLGPLNVRFSSSVLGGSEYSYNWSFGNGHYSLNADPSYTFPIGNYTVHFRVTSSNGASGEVSMPIRSLPPPVSFTYSSGLNITQAFHFQAVPNWDSSGPYNASWSFPNGQTLTGLNISYRFPVYQELNPVIVTFSYGNNTYSTILTVRMVPAKPSLTFTPPSQIPAGTMLSLNASATSPDSNSFTYSWNIEGSLYSSPDVLYFFNNPGNYSISLTVTDSLGASTTTTRDIQVITLGTNSSIVISYTSKSSGSETSFIVRILSQQGINAAEAFLGSTMVSAVNVNSTYTPSGELAYFNVTLNQRDFNSGTYPIKFVVFNNNSQSNSVIIPFTVSPSFAANQPFSLGQVIEFFGGTSNFVIIILTLAGVGITYAQLRRGDQPPEIVVNGVKGGKFKLNAKKVK